MSTIWTPSGEYQPREEPGPKPGAAPPPGGPQEAGGPDGPSPEEIEAALAEARAALDHPVLEHLAGHAMGLFELAALHLQREAATGEKPDLAEASLAIDGMAALVEGLGDRLGKYKDSLHHALSQLRLAYVEVKDR